MFTTLLVIILFINISLNFSPNTTEEVLSEHNLSLENRQPVAWVNDVFKKNILLTLAYLSDQDIGSNEFSLQPNETFAFHEDILPQFNGKVVKTTNAHFNHQEGFKSDGYLMGDGVCHLASLLYLAAKKANLETLAPTNHNFAEITDIPKEYGVSIYFNPGNKGGNAKQNLYITNNKTNPVTFQISYQDNMVKVKIVEKLGNPKFF